MQYKNMNRFSSCSGSSTAFLHSGGQKCNVTAVTEGVATELKQSDMYPAPSFSPADERLSGFNSIQ